MNFIFLLTIIFIFQKLSFSNISLNINRSKSFNSLTPININIQTSDVKERINPIDLILLVDNSGSMSGEKIKLVKEALSKLINFMGNEDKLTIIKFSSYSELVLNSTIMDSDGKSKALDKLKEFGALGGTNIFSSIEMGFDQIKFHNYSSDDRFPTMILLSDGEDSNPIIDKFKNLIEKNKDIIKQIPFNFHTLGFGLDHDACFNV